jgi:hypothetical protein
MQNYAHSNPYDRFLGTAHERKDARAVITATPGLLQQAIDALPPQQADTPIAPGKWSPREIVAHLADCELVHSFRLRQILAAPASHPAVFEPFDQDVWARHYAAYSLPLALELFRANRAWNVSLIGSLTAADFDRPAHHPERGDLTLLTLVETMAGHDLNHLGQLQQLKPTDSPISS